MYIFQQRKCYSFNSSSRNRQQLSSRVSTNELDWIIVWKKLTKETHSCYVCNGNDFDVHILLHFRVKYGAGLEMQLMLSVPLLCNSFAQCLILESFLIQNRPITFQMCRMWMLLLFKNIILYLLMTSKDFKKSLSIFNISLPMTFLRPR